MAVPTRAFCTWSLCLNLLKKARRLGHGESSPHRAGSRCPTGVYLAPRPSLGLIHHSDQGVQYTSLSFGKRLEDEGLLPSMGQAGTAYDNALAESFVATLKTELLYRNAWPTRQAARTAIFEYVEGFYNPRRRHSALGHLSPAEFEEVKLEEQDAA